VEFELRAVKTGRTKSLSLEMVNQVLSPSSCLVDALEVRWGTSAFAKARITRPQPVGQGDKAGE
jgi:hypothetical protein